ncbi:MAG: choice-of-anchor tandem repeat GloVer-containing protein [Luteolibacter sp.]|uniref:choice-of-anchor tandem repeat GloVer-containing protein n=1 Tax=Luteolibacter sp. TaxID=1962973 RepID=UPI003262D5B8
MKSMILRLFLICGSLAGIAAGQADLFADAQAISGSSGSVIGSNANASATLESGEPPNITSSTIVRPHGAINKITSADSIFPSGKSVWYRWTAPSNGKFTFSLTADFEAQLAVYTGSAPNTLTPMGGSDYENELGKPPAVELISLSADPAQVYWVRVTGRSTASGSFTLSWCSSPLNDNLANASVVNLTPGIKTVPGSNAGATGEVGEFASPYLIPQRRSVWYRVLVPAGYSISLSTEGSTFNTFVSLFRQTSSGWSGLIPLDGSDDTTAGTFSALSFVSNDSPVEYYIAVDGVHSATGNITLNFAVTPPPVYEKVFSFSDALAADLATGSSPVGTLVQASDGNFYGTTYTGGERNQGTVFKMTRGGILTTLVEFTGTAGDAKGWRPQAGLVQGGDGNFYGTTYSGGKFSSDGTRSYGTVFRMTPGGDLTTLVEFTGAGGDKKGSSPQAGLVQGSDGYFYGTTSGVDAGNFGTVFKMAPAGGPLIWVKEFTGTVGLFYKGAKPMAGLVQGSDGNFYGTTSKGGEFDQGTAFKLTPAGVLTTLVEFTGTGEGKNGGSPQAGLVRDSLGNFYGTTAGGGTYGFGTVFKISTDSTLTTLVHFTGNGASNKGRSPKHKLVQASDGNFYGTTYEGGAFDQGTVFKIITNGTLAGTTLVTLKEFKGAEPNKNGSNPEAGLVQGGDGNFYGTTYHGGIGGVNTGYDGFGTVFRMTPGGALTTLVEFTNIGVNNKGSSPEAGLAQDSEGNFYGTTKEGGGVTFPDGLGTVFKMTPAGALTTLVRFTDKGTDNKGKFPLAGLVRDGDGNFYGTTSGGDTDGFGTVFKMTAGGVLTTLVHLTGTGGNKKGSNPQAGLVQGLAQNNDGNFYGTTSGGGTSGLGTVFKMTPAGEMTWVKEFTGIGGGTKGAVPKAGLVRGSDGNFYGTTSGGGALGFGTVFKITPGGLLTTLAEFTGTAGDKKGSSPQSSLVRGSDGNFYGTTNRGGVGDGSIGGVGFGTVFRMTPGGEFMTLVEFTVLEDGNPSAPLMLASDGNLYGTTEGPGGSVYRLIFPGPPNVYAEKEEVQGTSSVLCQAMVNARGVNTAVFLEYWISESDLPSTVPIASALGGFQTTLVGTTLNNLSQGTTYYYRFRAVNSAGETTYSPPLTRPPASFSTLAAPVAVVSAASGVTSTSATLNGTVNARNYATAVSFEWSADVNFAASTSEAIPGTITEDTPKLVSKTVPGLTKGTTYFYRINATNSGGNTVSGTQSFKTLTEPTAAIGGSFALGTTSVRVEGTANAKGSDTTVVFEYSTDGEHFNSVPAVPGTISGETNTPVSATLPNLSQGVTYSYRIRVTKEGGLFNTSGLASFSVDALSGFTQVLPGVPAPSQGFLIVNLSPPGIGGWRFTGELAWRPSGIPVGGLTTGDRIVEFMPVSGYIHPSPEPVSINSGGAAEFVTGSYFLTGGSGNGSGGITVTLKPDSLASHPDVLQRIQWRLYKLGVNTDPWLNSGAIIEGLLPGSYLIECKPVTDRATPPLVNVVVEDGDPSLVTITYFLNDSQTGVAPAPIPFETVSTSTALPYSYVGQIRSDLGSSSGFVVKPRVVLTAGHVVFDDGTLSVVTGLQWLFQRDSISHEPVPVVPRGIHLMDDYAAARSAGGVVPGVGTTESQNRDAAALYFASSAGRGGYGGFLASDAADNEFLLSSAQKMLVGYPVDGVTAANRGRMHATPAMNVHFTRVPTLDEFGSPFRTYTTPDIRGSGGMSGGPMCVQFEGGSYYPAAIYLGGSNQTVVRAIDSKVIDVITRAEAAAAAGDNQTGGGYTLSSFSTISGGSSLSGQVKVVIKPDAARDAGAFWRVNTRDYHGSGDIDTLPSAGSPYTLYLTPVAGFDTPDPAGQSLDFKGGKIQTVTYTYIDENDPPTISNIGNKTIDEDTSTAAIPITLGDPDDPANSLELTGSSSDTTLVPDAKIVFSGSGANRTVTVTPAANRNGSAIITITVSDGKLSTTETFQLTVDPVNDPPTISSIPDQTIPVNTATAAIPLTLGDVDNPTTFELQRASSNTTLVPNAKIVFGGSGTARTVTITPASGQLGTATITITVKDGSLPASRTFLLTVTGTPLENWRFIAFGTASGTGSAADNADPDGDGNTNIDEYAAGTDPDNPADVFKVLTVGKTAGTCTLAASGKAARTYILERRANLLSGTWTTVTSAGPFPIDTTITLTDPSPFANSGFYRIRVFLP